MFADFMPPDQRLDPNIQDPPCMVACPSSPDHLWVRHHNGIFHSSDGGQHWQHCDQANPSGVGFAVAAHPRDPQTAWFVPGVKDESVCPWMMRCV